MDESRAIGTKLLVYSMRNFAFKSLIWLVAAMTSVQPLTAGSCSCAMAGSCGGEAENQQRPVAEKACCRQARTCCAGNPVESHSCCQGTAQGSAKRCCAGTAGCSCRLDDTSPPKQPAPAEGSNRAADELAQPLTAVSSSLGEFQVVPVIFGDDCPTTSSGLERCIVLCRFNL